MIPRARFSMKVKLLSALGFIGILIIALLSSGEHLIHDASQRLDTILNQQVKPLARANSLQYRIDRIHALELELPGISDYFAVTSHLELLKSEISEFEQELSAFTAQMTPQIEKNAVGINEHWSRYNTELGKIISHAEEMDMKRVEYVTAFQAANRFKAISRILRQLALTTEQNALQEYQTALKIQKQQRWIFIALSIAGMVLATVFIYRFTHSLLSRVSNLRDAATRVADDVGEQPIPIQGNDELSELSTLFNAMQTKVMARENALRVAQEKLEERVQERTSELIQSNEKLLVEVEERERAETQLHLLSLAVEQSPVSVMITDKEGNIEYVNPAFSRKLGYSNNEAIGNNPRFLKSGFTDPKRYRELWATIKSGKDWSGEILSRCKDGNLIWENIHISPVSDTNGVITNFLALREDITEKKEHEERILYQAHYDSLTGLPNRFLAIDRLGQAIDTAKRSTLKTVLMFLDLDDFKKVNDSLGHAAGDKLLVQAAERLEKAVRKEDSVARLGGDEFVVIMNNVPTATEAEFVALKIITAFESGFIIDESELVVTPSIGISVYPDDGDSPEILLRNADLAMYKAKESGRNTFHFFNQAIHDQSLKYLEMEKHLRHALQRNEFSLAYQPLIDSVDHALVGAEALLRWDNPVFGAVSPAQFISIAEQTGLIVEIGDWVIEQACQQAFSWKQQGTESLRIAVNVSPRQFRGTRLVDTVKRCLKGYQIPAHLFQIEITEGVLVRNQPEVHQILQELDQLGVQLAMDDFGIGYSSLSYLKNFPFRTLKIDRSFISGLATNQDDHALVTAVINMGKGLGLTIVAEGVENEDQMKILSDMGCNMLQGYLFSKPISPEDFLQNWITPSRENAI